MDAVQPALAHTISAPLPWAPAFAGVTKGKGAPLTLGTVIPAQAGIHSRKPHGAIATPARLDPRLREKDEKGGARVTVIHSAMGFTNPVRHQQ
jgi:hypothetical protein